VSSEGRTRGLRSSFVIASGSEATREQEDLNERSAVHEMAVGPLMELLNRWWSIEYSQDRLYNLNII
jgi:hypothetical protein